MTKGTIWLSLVSSVGASLCCIAPVLALFSGMGGAASAFSGMEPARPYLITSSVIFLGIAWFGKLRVQKEDDCGCAPPKKRALLRTTGFLGVLTLIAILLMTFPLYAHWLSPNKKPIIATSANVSTSEKQVTFLVKGMGCSQCEPEVESAVRKLTGIRYVKASCIKKNTVVTFDSTKTTVTSIQEAINSTGYTVQSINP